MGKPTGFLEYKRNDPGYRPKEERINDFRAVERQLKASAVQKQAARCMDCGTPFCHAFGCPVSNIIPEFNDFVYRGHWQQALHILCATNNFPEFTGRVCPAPCEAACVAGINGDPVTIRQIELAIIENGFERGYVASWPPPVRSGEKVAVIGAGPAGMAVADTLNKAGYCVTVFDTAKHPGGILRYGIPDFKLEKWVVERRVRLMREEGVEFEMEVTVGEDVSYGYLTKRYDALCLACGARKPRDLTVPGRDLKGIHFAMDYLMQQNQKIGGEPIDPAEEIVAEGKRVVVIGGGDTGSDCVGTALRQRARHVLQLEILPKPPPQRSDATPWPLWPFILRNTHAHEEGGETHWSVMTKTFIGERGKLKKLRCAEVVWETPPGGGAPFPKEKPATDFEVEADLVLLAMGFVGPEENRIADGLGLKKDSRGNIQADHSHMTSVEGIFVAGDMTRGQSLVVRAIADGREAARGIVDYCEQKRRKTRAG